MNTETIKVEWTDGTVEEILAGEVVATAEEWGRALRTSRRIRGMTRADLAERIGCAVSTVGRWERGQTRPSDQDAGRLAEVLPGLPDYPVEEDDLLARVAEAARSGMTCSEIGRVVLGGRTRQRAQQLIARAKVEGHDVRPPRREPETWGEALADLRTRAGLGQAELGERVGRCSATIGAWEADSRAPGDEAVAALRAILPDLPPHPRPARPRRGPRPESLRSRVAARLAAGATRSEVVAEFDLDAHRLATIASWARARGILPTVESEREALLDRVAEIADRGGVPLVAAELGVAESWARTLVRRAQARAEG